MIMIENLVNGRGQQEYRETIPEWEQELWFYLSAGDGDICPVYANCPIRKAGGYCYCPIYNPSLARVGGGWCMTGHNGGIVQAIDNIPCCSGHCHLTGYDVTEHRRPGRIFKLPELLAQKYLEMGKVYSPPVPATLIRLVSLFKDIEVRVVPLKAYHGAIWGLKDEWIIHLNKTDTLARRRLTLFHEAFHILAHTRSNPTFKKVSSEKGSFNELLAENFAYHILMPKDWVEKKWAEVKDVDTLAKFFNVPETAMDLRLKSLRLV